MTLPEVEADPGRGAAMLVRFGIFPEPAQNVGLMPMLDL